MKRLRSHFQFNKEQRSGIFFLLLLIVVSQGAYFLLRSNGTGNNNAFSLDASTQARVDSLKTIAAKKESTKIFPFNPNYITDFKGYTLGMSPEEIDRLHNFRVQNKFVNSAVEFQQVTQISDSFLKVLSPYFKFPDWVSNRKVFPIESNREPRKVSFEILDLNKANAEQLKLVNGIGDKLSSRIIKFRDALGGFLVNEQLYDVYGLDTEVANRVLNRFQVIDAPTVQKISVNTASIEELVALPYLRYEVARKIVTKRKALGPYNSLSDLNEIPDFPKDKIERIKLYLSL